MEPVTTEPTQVKHPTRATFRTIVQGLIALAAVLPLIFATAGVPPVGIAAILIGIAGAITRVMAVPAVEDFLEKYLPFLAAKPKSIN
jgi:Na+/H+ antiporter NhaB